MEASDSSAAKAEATENRKVLMEWELSNQRPWLHSRDKSQWFNYDLDERSLKEWVQRQLDVRYERLKRHKVQSYDFDTVGEPYIGHFPQVAPTIPAQSEVYSINLQRSANAQTKPFNYKSEPGDFAEDTA